MFNLQLLKNADIPYLHMLSVVYEGNEMRALECLVSLFDQFVPEIFKNATSNQNENEFLAQGASVFTFRNKTIIR